ncbi:MAG: aldehyde dehydrogenase family protein [bacterium]
MKIESINPRTGKSIETFEEIKTDELSEIIIKSKKAQKSWARLPSEERIKVILKLSEIIDREKEQIAEIVFEEAGFLRTETLGEITGDILIGIESHIMDYNAVKELDFSNETFESKVQFMPQGVIGHIGIWNYPVWQTFITAIPALLVGNAIIYKLSEFTTMTGLKIAEMIWESGVPKDVFIPVSGGSTIGQEIVKSDVDMIVFTGGSGTGNKIIKEAGTKPLLLELSGNDAGIICEDCDLKQTIKGVIWGSFLHGGQVCTRIKRVFVERDISEKFLDGFLEQTKRLKIGEQIAPLIRAEAREKVDDQVQESIKGGAKLLLGGNKSSREGFYFEPTILLYEDSNATMYEDEIFGPVALVQIVENVDEAIKKSNDTKYGLGATIWTRDQKKAMFIAEKLDVGMVWINDSNAAIPGGVYYGGIKESGIASSQKRVMSFMKKKMIISNSKAEIRDWWYS